MYLPYLLSYLDRARSYVSLDECMPILPTIYFLLHDLYMSVLRLTRGIPTGGIAMENLPQQSTSYAKAAPTCFTDDTRAAARVPKTPVKIVARLVVWGRRADTSHHRGFYQRKFPSAERSESSRKWSCSQERYDGTRVVSDPAYPEIICEAGCEIAADVCDRCSVRVLGPGYGGVGDEDFPGLRNYVYALC